MEEHRLICPAYPTAVTAAGVLPAGTETQAISSFLAPKYTFATNSVPWEKSHGVMAQVCTAHPWRGKGLWAEMSMHHTSRHDPGLAMESHCSCRRSLDPHQGWLQKHGLRANHSFCKAFREMSSCWKGARKGQSHLAGHCKWHSWRLPSLGWWGREQTPRSKEKQKS